MKIIMFMVGCFISLRKGQLPGITNTLCKGKQTALFLLTLIICLFLQAQSSWSATTLYAGFAGAGIWKYDGTTWTQATPNTPQLMAVSGSTLYSAFVGAGIWKWDGVIWTQLTSNEPVSMVSGVEWATCYMANRNISGTVSAYSIDATTGALTEIAGSPFTANAYPSSVTVDLTGKYAYVANSGTGSLGGGISAYSIDAAYGALTAIAGSPFAAGTYPSSVTVDTTGKFIYALGSSGVYAYSIGATGALTAIAGSPFAAGTYPSSVTVAPTGKYAYVANSNNGGISAYSIGATGALTAIAGSPFAAGSSSQSVTVDPSGKYAYVIDFSGIYAYSIGTTGALTAIAGSPFGPGSEAYGITVDPSGKYVYVASYDNQNVSAYSIGATGVLTAIAGSPFSGRGSESIIIVKR